MIKTWLKHQIFEICIDIIFAEIYNNFVLPKILPQLDISIGENEITISDGKNSMTTAISDIQSIGGATSVVFNFLKLYHPKLHSKVIALL